MKDLAKSLLLSLVVTFITLLAGELILRHWFEPFAAAEEERFLVRDAQLGWTNRASFDSTFSSAQKGYRGHVTFDAEGLRVNGVAQVSAPDLTVLVIGDSTTAGLEVDNEKTFVSLLEQQFRQAGYRANVINAGVRGFGTDQSYLRLIRLAPLLHPDLVIYLSCGNDFSDNLTVKNWYRPYSKPTFILHDGALQLTNEPIEDFAKGEYAFVKYADENASAATIETGYLKPEGLRGWFRDHSAVYGLAETFYYVHLSSTVFRVVKRNPQVEARLISGLVEKMRAVAPNLYVTGFTKEKGGDGIGYDEVAKIARDLSVPFLDTRPYFKKGVRYDYVTDSHWNETGHAQEAAALWAELNAHHALDRFKNSLTPAKQLSSVGER